jgi:ArsR family transcriptional regulator
MHRHLSIGGLVAKRVHAVDASATEQCCPSVLASPLDAVQAELLASGFNALADPVRLRVLSILAAAPEGEVCVCDFVKPVGKSQPTVSHHLKILSDAGLVHGDRRGKWVWYSLDRERLADLRAALQPTE